jgi:hypothetical protein
MCEGVCVSSTTEERESDIRDSVNGRVHIKHNHITHIHTHTHIRALYCRDLRESTSEGHSAIGELSVFLR